MLGKQNSGFRIAPLVMAIPIIAAFAGIGWMTGKFRNKPPEMSGSTSVQVTTNREPAPAGIEIQCDGPYLEQLSLNLAESFVSGFNRRSEETAQIAASDIRRSASCKQANSTNVAVVDLIVEGASIRIHLGVNQGSFIRVMCLATRADFTAIENSATCTAATETAFSS